jgi:hypothetical protein
MGSWSIYQSKLLGLNDARDTAKEAQIGFRLDLWLRGMMFNPAGPNGLSFVIEEPRRLSLSVRPIRPDHGQFGDRRGLPGQRSRLHMSC